MNRRGDAGIGTAGLGQSALHTGHIAEILADNIEVEGRSHDHGAVASEHRDDVIRVEAQPADQVVKIGKADRARDHAEEASVFARYAAAEHDGIGAVMQRRAADEQASIGLLPMNPEIFLAATVFRQRIERRGVDDQFSIGIEHLDRAEMFGSSGAVEQDQVPHRPGDLVDLGRCHVGRYRAQRQVVKFDVAADIGIDSGCEIFQRLARQLFFAVAHVEHHAGADRRKAHHRDNRGNDQQLCR